MIAKKYVNVFDTILSQADRISSEINIEEGALAYNSQIENEADLLPPADDSNQHGDAYDEDDYDEADKTNVEDDHSETASLAGSETDDGEDFDHSRLASRNSIGSRGYRRIVKECVREVIEQMLDSGLLVQQGNVVGQFSGKKSRQYQEFEPTSKGKTAMKGSAPLGKSKQAGYYYHEDEDDPLEDMCNTLRQLWSPLLHVPENKIHDDDSFFYLGGDSILAMELVRHARDAGARLTVATIFGSPVFSDMAEAMVLAAQNAADDDKNDETNSVDARQMAVLENHPAPFSLLPTSKPDAFVQDYICPKVGVFRSGIIDAFPVTDFQSLAVAGSQLEARWMLNYFTFDGVGFVDLERLRNAASQVVQCFDILRTVFLPCGDRFIQVVLRSLKPQFQVHETDIDLAEYTRQLREDSSTAYPKLGEPFTQFLFIKKKGSNAHRIAIRLSHAQYDGVCLPSIIEAFQAAYECRDMPSPSPPFSNFIHDATAGSSKQGHEEYWRSLLQGSTITRIVNRDQPKYGGTDMALSTLKKTVKLPALTAQNVTTASIVKAAWAIVLAQLSGRNDVVFGTVISGRNAAVEGVASIVAPCVNVVPVRVQIEPTWTALDLLRWVQNQQVAGMAFESLGFREIIQQCTDWPAWTYYSSIVQHQNLTEDFSENEMKIGRTKYKVGHLGSQETLSDFTLVSTPKGSDMVEVNLSFYNDGSIAPNFVQRVLDLTCSVAQNFASNPRRALPSMSELSSVISTTSPPEAIRNSNDSLEMAKLDASLRRLNKLELCDIADILTRSWRLVLPRRRETPSVLTLESSFYDAGGDIISLASLSSVLENEGFKTRLEELIARPTVGAQVALLAEQRKKMGMRLGGSESSSETLQGSASSTEELKGPDVVGKKGNDAKKEQKEGEKAEKRAFWKLKPGKFGRRLGLRRGSQQVV